MSQDGLGSGPGPEPIRLAVRELRGTRGRSGTGLSWARNIGMFPRSRPGESGSAELLQSQERPGETIQVSEQVGVPERKKQFNSPPPMWARGVGVSLQLWVTASRGERKI